MLADCHCACAHCCSGSDYALAALIATACGACCDGGVSTELSFRQVSGTMNVAKLADHEHCCPAVQPAWPRPHRARHLPEG